MKKKAVILFSGGLDSTTCLAYARSLGFECYTLSFSYGQKHTFELHAANKIAKWFNVEHKVFNIDIGQFGHTSLTDFNITVPKHEDVKNEIPNTYVPARNTIFLSVALAWAETLDAKDIFIGISSVDYSLYPDCRPEYISTFQQLANLATKKGVEEGGIHIHAPLLNLSKAETIKLGTALGVDYQMTVTCYQLTSEGKACGYCGSCSFRKLGFKQANLFDPTEYV